MNKVFKMQDLDCANCAAKMERAINTIDAMSATIERIDWDVLQRITDRILAEVPNVNRVCYDMSPKPPATIEFE